MRQQQKQRTREAILGGARALLARGDVVTVAAAAAEAGVSKATAYRYFSDAAAMTAEAGLAVHMAAYEEVVAGAADTRARLRAICLYYFDLACDHEGAFRQFLARNLDAWSAETPLPARRGARRVDMLTRALADERGLSATARRNLVAGLASATGAEAMVALFDVAGLERAEARAVVVANVGAIIDAYLAEKVAP